VVLGIQAGHGQARHQAETHNLSRGDGQVIRSPSEASKWHLTFLSRYLRSVGIPALGFSPMNNTPVLLHDHNEFLNEKIFIRGIDIFEDIISEMADM